MKSHTRSSAVRASRVTIGRALRAEALRLRRSPLIALHVVCGLVAGLLCGAYFSVAAWDPSFGIDAYVQMLGALMPLMVGIVCGLDIDAEREVGAMGNLLAVPARRTCLAARLLALFLLGVFALAIAVAVFGGVLFATGRMTLPVWTLVSCVLGLGIGSVTVYTICLFLALRFGRNVAIALGGVGLILSFFAIGGLAHGLMTGQLTAASGGILGVVPFAWPTRLGSLFIELGIAQTALGAPAAAQVAGSLLQTGVLSVVGGVVAVMALLGWFGRFEEGRRDA